MSPQESIAHYRIVCKPGEGGNGSVYQARETRLNYDVAIAVLPDVLPGDQLAAFGRIGDAFSLGYTAGKP